MKYAKIISLCILWTAFIACCGFSLGLCFDYTPARLNANQHFNRAFGTPDTYEPDPEMAAWIAEELL